MKIFSKTDIGKIRKSNQDALGGRVISDNLAWSVICDGMGGASGGDIASSTAVEEITVNLDSKLSEKMNSQKIEETMSTAIQNANAAIFGKSEKNKELKKMGTTVVLCVIVNDMLHVMHAGDSRAYILGDKSIEQITSDHSIVQEMVNSGEITPEEAKNHPQKNIITRALGTRGFIRLDYKQVPLEKDQTVLLCTDGLTNHLDEKEILEICTDDSQNSPEDELVDLANSRGGTDNITVSVIKY